MDSYLKIFPQNIEKGIQIDTNLNLAATDFYKSAYNDYFLKIYSPDIINNQEFYTDSCGLYVLKRKIN